METEDFVGGVRAATEVLSSVFFRPNILFMALTGEGDGDNSKFEALLARSPAYKMGVVLLARHPVLELGREQVVNVWVREQSPDWKLGLRLSNLDLSVLLAYQLIKNWKGEMNLCMAIDSPEMKEQAERYLNELIKLGRLTNTKAVIVEGNFREALERVPRADLNFFGLPREMDLSFVRRVYHIVDASCLFVRDSGNESALA